MEPLIYSVLIGAVIGFAFRCIFTNKNHTLFEQAGNSVIIRATSYARLVNDQTLTIKSEDIVKLQLTGTCISLLSISGHAIDIWLNKKSIDSTVRNAIECFPHAKLIKLDSSRPLK